MTDAEHNQMCRRLANCAAYNQTEGLRLAVCLLHDMADKSDPRTTASAVLRAAADNIRDRIRERKADWEEAERV